jgi:ATP-dependent DNA helicase UvrD/PcrA
VTILEHLNPAQAEAVTHTEGPLLIVAGAGSGKTRVLTHRVAYLLDQGVAASRVLAVTFTNKAANEMKERIRRLVGQRSYDIWIGTFHAICARILRQDGDHIGLHRDFVVFDDTDQLALVRECLKALDISDEEFKPRAVLSAISRAKEELLTPERYRRTHSGLFEEVVGRVYDRYQGRLTESRALDFDDLIMAAVRLLRENQESRDHFQEKFRYVLVDEYQDINFAQYELVKLLAGKHRNLCVVGDDDQSVYSFRGARVELLLQFDRDFPGAKIVKLEQNYRSTQTILDAAHSVVSCNIGRRDKRLWTENPTGEPIPVYEATDEQDEGEFVARALQTRVEAGTRTYGDFAILYRTNAQSRVLEDVFVRRKIPYRIVGTLRFYERREVKDILAYLRLILNPVDGLSLRRVLNVPARGIGAISLQRLEAHAEREQVPLFEALRTADSIEALTPRVRAAVREFVTIIDLLHGYRESLSITALATEVLDRTGYVKELQAEHTLEAQSRLENVQEFLSATKEFDETAEGGLTAFLEHLALMSDLDSYVDATDAVTLMTLHSAKGLEFPSVLLVGMEENILPHVRSIHGDTQALEEERRLCYVGITRAREELIITYASRRTLFGNIQANRPSRFLGEIPAELLRDAGLPQSRVAGRGSRAGGDEGWDEPPTFGSGRATRDPRPATSGSLASLDVQSLVDRLRAKKSGRFKGGDLVSHPVFGVGVVTKSTGTGDDEQVSVVFRGHGEKKLLLAFAKLEKVES